MSDFYQQVREVSQFKETRGEIIDYFKGLYPGGKLLKNGKTIENWKSKLVAAVQPFTFNKDMAHLSKATLNRRFETGRENSKISRVQEQEYRELGETLPFDPPENGYHVWGEVWVKYSDGQCEPRDVDEYITGEDARKLAKEAYEGTSKSAAQMVVNHYQDEDVDNEEPTASIGDCQEPELYVEAIE